MTYRISAILAASTLLLAPIAPAFGQVNPSALPTAKTSTSAMLTALKSPGKATLEPVLAADFRLGVMSSDASPGEPNWQPRHVHGGIYFYVFRHPEHGIYLIDAGLPKEGLKCVPDLAQKMLKLDTAIQGRRGTGDYLAGEKPNAVFLTHLHFDHFPGVRDLPGVTPVYSGPGEGNEPPPLSLVLEAVTNCVFKGREEPVQWRFQADPDKRLGGVIDIFGDGSLFAISVPGHTAGSTAYIINAVDGVHLITGDVAQTQAAWAGQKIDKSASEPNLNTLWTSLDALRSVAGDIPNLKVHVGHEPGA
ncbi:MAG: MBL fold metallo-hydrolase [Asticcacaulis sp.]